MKNDFTHKQLTKRLGQYSALAAAFMSTASVNAANVFTDVDPDAVIGIGDVLNIDVDGDGTDDFAVFGSTFFSINYVAVSAPVNGVNGLVGGTGTYQIYPLMTGDAINATQPFRTQTGSGFPGVLLGSSGGLFGSPTPPDVSEHVGLRFDVGGNTHYGWIEVDVNGPDEVVVKRYGYNDVPDATSLACLPIPTMSQWGLITFALLMLSFGTIAIGRRKHIMPDGSTVDMGIAHEFRNPPFKMDYFKKASMLTLGLVGLATGGTLWAYGTIALVDIVGFAIAAPIFTYLTHLMMHQNNEWKKNQQA